MASTVTNIFGATSTTEDVLSGIDLRGKRSRRAFLAGAIALTGVVSLPADEIISGGPYSSRQELVQRGILPQNTFEELERELSRREKRSA